MFRKGRDVEIRPDAMIVAHGLVEKRLVTAARRFPIIVWRRPVSEEATQVFMEPISHSRTI
jgi:hypothetical protein